MIFQAVYRSSLIEQKVIGFGAPNQSLKLFGQILCQRNAVHTDQFRVSRPYLEPRRYEDRVDRDGFSMTFTSMHRPLSAYTEALSGHGFAVTALREYGDRAIPWLLTLRAEKRRSPG